MSRVWPTGTGGGCPRWPPSGCAARRRAGRGRRCCPRPPPPGCEVAGFDPVGEVMGSMVQRIGWSSYCGCGVRRLAGADSQTITSGSHPRAGFAPYAHALENGWATAIGRMVTEAARHRGRRHRRRPPLAAEPRQRASASSPPWAPRVRARSATRPGRVFSHAPGRPGRRQAGPRGLDARRAGARHRGRDPPRRLEHPPAAHVDRGQHRGRRVHRAGQPDPGRRPHARAAPHPRGGRRRRRHRRRWACPPGRSSPGKATPTTSPRPRSSPRRSRSSTARAWRRAGP